MRFLETLREWWSKLTDPRERSKRRERKKAKEMAKFLERNERRDEESVN